MSALVFRRGLCGALLGAAFTCSLAHGQLITPTSVTVEAGTQFFSAAGLIDNSGLSATPTLANFATVTHSAAGAGNAWVTTDPGGALADYFALDPAIAPVPVMTFALDGTYELQGLLTWGYHFGDGNGNETKSFLLEFSTDGGATFGASTTVTKPAASIAASDYRAFGAAYSANAVRVSFTDNFFEDWPGGDRVGLGELKFAVNIPEPSTALLALVLVPAALRRRVR